MGILEAATQRMKMEEARYEEQIAALKAENERLTKALSDQEKEMDEWVEARDAEIEASFDAGHYRAMSEHATPWKIRAETAERALAERAGGVKVRELVDGLLDLRDLIMRGKRCVTDTGPAVKPVIELASVHILDDAANALEALTTEPAAPEGRQEDDRIRREMDEILRKQSERDIPFAPSTRPAEQAVTEAMVEAAAKSLRPDLFTPIKADVLQSDDYALTCRRNAKIDVMGKARAALKAAMEAGRHE